MQPGDGDRPRHRPERSGYSGRRLIRTRTHLPGGRQHHVYRVRQYRSGPHFQHRQQQRNAVDDLPGAMRSYGRHAGLRGGVCERRFGPGQPIDSGGQPGRLSGYRWPRAAGAAGWLFREPRESGPPG